MPSMRVLVGTLLASVISLGGIMALALFFFMIYAILGVSTWNGRVHYRCYETEWPLALPPYDHLNAAELQNVTAAAIAEHKLTFQEWKLVPDDPHLCHKVERPCNRTVLRRKDGPKPPKKSSNPVLDESAGESVASQDASNTNTAPKRFLIGPELTGATSLSVGSLSEPSAFPDKEQIHQEHRKLQSEVSGTAASSSPASSAGDASGAINEVNNEAGSE